MATESLQQKHISEDDEESEDEEAEQQLLNAQGNGDGEEVDEDEEDEGDDEVEGDEDEDEDDEDEGENEEDGLEGDNKETILDVASLLYGGKNDEEGEKTLVPSVFKLDVGNLLIFDYQEQVKGISPLEKAQRSTQQLFESIFNLPVTPSEVGPIASLPQPITPIPREKPIPRAKSMTKWEKYAKEKGIKKKKRSSRVWDEATQEWRPRWGSKSIKNDPTNTWLMEDKPEEMAKYNAEDPFHLEKLKKKERIEKNKVSQLKNLKRTDAEIAAELPATLDITKNAPNHQKYAIQKALALAQVSTASLGRFDKKLSDEPEIKRRSHLVTSSSTESKIADRVLKKAESEGEINLDKAARAATKKEEEKNRKRKLDRPSNKKNVRRGEYRGTKNIGKKGGKFKRRRSE